MAKETKNVEVAVETVAQSGNEQTKVLSHEEAIAAFIAAGAELKESLHVERCAVTTILDADGNNKNTIVTVTVRETVRRMLLDETIGSFEKKDAHHFVLSLISLLKILGKNEVFAPFTRKLQQQSKLLEMLLPGCKLSVLAINVEAGVEYTNFFTGNKSVPDNTSIYYEPTAVIAGQFAAKQLEQAAQAVLMNALLS